jgi:hypothetical protein
MTDAVGESGPFDAFRVAVARSELEQVSERRAAASLSADRLTALDQARAIGMVLYLAAKKLGIAEVDDLDELLRLILARAHTGGLDPASYRVAWTLAHAPQRDAPGEETAIQ